MDDIEEQTEPEKEKAKTKSISRRPHQKDHPSRIDYKEEMKDEPRRLTRSETKRLEEDAMFGEQANVLLLRYFPELRENLLKVLKNCQQTVAQNTGWLQEYPRLM